MCNNGMSEHNALCVWEQWIARITMLLQCKVTNAWITMLLLSPIAMDFLDNNAVTVSDSNRLPGQ